MEKICDVLVVGAGPAGSSAARAAAGAGAKTILIDKKEEIGVPVQCAEAIGKYLFPLLPIRVPKDQLVWRIRGMIFWAEGIKITRRGRFWAGYAIDRKNFDKWLASLAVKAGAELQTSAELVNLEVSDEYKVERAYVRTPRGMTYIRPGIVVAADGVESSVLRLLGFKIDKKENLGEVLGFEMRNLNLEKPNYDHLFIGDFAPGGYAYVFPKSKHVANVGVATLFPDKSLEEYYEEFLEIPEVRRQLDGGLVVEEKSGKAPARDLVDKWVYGNVLLAGDAANQNIKPFVEGILPSIICGDIAGKVATAVIRGEGLPNEYPKKVMMRFSKLLNQSNSLGDIAYKLAEMKSKEADLLRLALSANILSLEKIKQLRFKNYMIIKKEVEKWRKSVFKRLVTATKEELSLAKIFLHAK